MSTVFDLQEFSRSSMAIKVCQKLFLQMLKKNELEASQQLDEIITRDALYLEAHCSQKNFFSSSKTVFKRLKMIEFSTTLHH